MEIKKMEEIYQGIGSKVISMIPCKWNTIYLYSEILDGAIEVFFYFEETKTKEILYGHDVSKMFNVDERIYDQLLDELMDQVLDLYNEYKENNERVWTNFTLTIEDTGKFNIQFNYDNLLENELSDWQRQVVWEYEILGLEPQNEEDKKVLTKYLEKRSSV